MTLSRRDLFLRTAAVAPLAAALAACASHPTADTLVSKTQIAVDAFMAFVADIEAFGITISQKVVDQVNILATDVETNATEIATALDPAPVFVKITQVVKLIGDLLASYFPNAPRLAAAFNATLKLFLDTATQFGITVPA